MTDDEQQESQRIQMARKAEAEAMRTPTRQSRKRKLNKVDSDDTNSDKENISLPRPAPRAKRIRREKTGTEWQTVLDLVKFEEEQRRREQNEAVTVPELETSCQSFESTFLNSPIRRDISYKT
ncbi:hypothetical protein EDD22DRAFT_850313 [Suillus occidentalis]|nr:hypothetical protein EDD22DRAFT_850313 [Suillus occidentalis]